MLAHDTMRSQVTRKLPSGRIFHLYLLQNDGSAGNLGLQLQQIVREEMRRIVQLQQHSLGQFLEAFPILEEDIPHHNHSHIRHEEETHQTSRQVYLCNLWVGKLCLLLHLPW